MSTTIKTIALIFITLNAFIFSSCDKNDDAVPKPVINILELGKDNSRVAYIGKDLHIEAEIKAEGKIDFITVEIHMEEGEHEEIMVRFDDYADLKSTTFHEHLEIPAETEEGDYHFHLTVTDQEGNQTTVEDEISIEVPTE
ncbi:DUF4625 domain-containing protein [Mariniphaga anaerophila]|nr:DUF4625 domain-containing protein [Mariniphaga anaerophila]